MEEGITLASGHADKTKRKLQESVRVTATNHRGTHKKKKKKLKKRGKKRLPFLDPNYTDC